MRVVHICNLPLPADHPDFGRISMHPGRWVLNLAIAQKKHTRIQTELVVHVPGASQNFITDIDGIRVHFLSAPNRLRAATLFFFDRNRISHYVRSLKPDFVHAHGTEESYLLAAQATGIPYLVTAQGCYFIINREMPPSLISRARVVEFTESVALNRANHIIAKSCYVAEALRLRFPHLEIYEIPNTFDSRLIQIPFDSPREPASLAFVGTVVERKGVHLIAEALENNEELSSKVVLHVFGNRPDSPGAYESEVLGRLRAKLGDRLVLHGTVSGQKVAEALSRIKVLLAPSLEEMFGNQLIEALLVGTLPIVAEGTALAENVRRFGRGTVIPQKQSKLLAEAISSSLGEEFSPIAAGNVRAHIDSWMGPESVALRHEELYGRIEKSRDGTA